MTIPTFTGGDTASSRDTVSQSVQKTNSLAASLAGENGGIVLTDGSEFTLDIVNPGTDTATVSLSVTGRTFTVTLAYADSAATTTWAEVRELLAANAVWPVLVTETEKEGYVGTQVPADATHVLTGGTVTIQEDTGGGAVDFLKLDWITTATGPFRSFQYKTGGHFDLVLTDAWSAAELDETSFAANTLHRVGDASATLGDGVLILGY